MTAWFTEHFPNVVALGLHGDTGWVTSIIETLFMVFWSGLFGGILGLVFGVALVVTNEGGITPHRGLYSFLDKFTSIFRAVPFIVLLAIIAPVTQKIVGTQTLGVFPFYARQVQVALESVNKGTVEAAQTVGANFWDIVFTVYLREELGSLIRVSTVTIISLIGLTAMAGAIGAGGLGNTAIAYGYNRFSNDVTFLATLLILILVLLVQVIGDTWAKSVTHK